MMVDSIDAAALRVPFRQAFRHAAAVRSETQAVWVEARAGGSSGFGEGCPRPYVTGESLATASRFVAACRREWLAEIKGVESLRRWVSRRRPLIDRHPAAWCAVELALLDLFGRTSGRTMEVLLGTPRLSGLRRYTAVLGDGPPEQFQSQLDRYFRAGFRDYKIKLSGDLARDRRKIDALAAIGLRPEQVRADANNHWRCAAAAVRYLRALGSPFTAVEEPLAPGDFDGMRRIGAELGIRIVLDESFLRIGQLDSIAGDPGRWIVNLRVSKMGGVLRSLELLEALRQSRHAVICGAHVGETSVLTRAALGVAQCAGDILLGMEGAFGTHLLVRDVTDTPIMFREGGRLDAAWIATGGGLGIAISRPAALVAL